MERITPSLTGKFFHKFNYISGQTGVHCFCPDPVWKVINGNNKHAPCWLTSHLQRVMKRPALHRCHTLDCRVKLVWGDKVQHPCWFLWSTFRPWCLSFRLATRHEPIFQSAVGRLLSLLRPASPLQNHNLSFVSSFFFFRSNLLTDSSLTHFAGCFAMQSVKLSIGFNWCFYEQIFAVIFLFSQLFGHFGVFHRLKYIAAGSSSSICFQSSCFK